MTHLEALNILDRASSMALVSRADHVAIQQAVEQIKTLIASLEEKEKPA